MPRLQNKESHLYLWLLLGFKLILDYSYVLLSNEDAYSIEFALNINFFKVALSYVIIILVGFLSCSNNTIVSYLFRIISFFVIAPLSTVFAFRDESSVYYFLVVITFIITEYISVRQFSSKMDLEDWQVKPTKRDNLLNTLCVVISLLTLFLMYVSNGVPNINTVILENVYEVRGSYNTSSYLSYLLYVTAQVIIPLGIAISFTRKRYLLSFFYLLSQFCFFLWTGHKTWFFSIFLMLLLIIILRAKKGVNYLFIAVVALSLLAVIFYENIYGYGAFTLLNRRVLLDPAALRFFYYDYFLVKGHPIVGFSGTVLAPIFGSASPADLDYAYSIASIYTDTPSNAGTGIYGGDLANLGVLSFIIVPICLVFFSYLANITNRAMSSSFTILLFTYITFSFNDQRIFAYLLDFRGVFLILFVLLLSSKVAHKKSLINNEKYKGTSSLIER